MISTRVMLGVMFVDLVATGLMLAQKLPPAEIEEPAVPAAVGDVDWVPIPGDKEWVAVAEDGKQIGAYNVKTGRCAAIDGTGRWVHAGDRAFCTRDAEAMIRLIRNPGVAWRKVQAEPTGYRIGSRIVSEADAIAELKPQEKLPNDAALPSLTLIGTESTCKAVEAEIKADSRMATLSKRYLLQSYRPDDVMVASFGFVTTGKPTIYMQEPGGRVIFRSDEYPGIDTLAAAVEEGCDQCCPPRKPRPDNDPKLDPEPMAIIRGRHSYWWVAWTALGGMGAFALGVASVVSVTAVVIVGRAVWRRRNTDAASGK